MGRKRTKSQYAGDRWQYSLLPIMRVSSNPEGPDDAIGLDQIQISQGFCHPDNLNEAIRELHNNDLKNIQFQTQHQMITAKCPKCKQEGKATFSLDPRKRSKKWIERATPILLHYYHGSKKHYIGTWKNFQIHRSPNVESFENILKKSMKFLN